MEDVRIYEMPPCKMVSSGPGMFGEGVLEKFDGWFSTLRRTLFPRDFLWMDQESGKFVWYYQYEEGMAVPEEFAVVDFPGGLFAVAADVDGEDNREVIGRIRTFAEEKGFRVDPERPYMGNVITSPAAKKILGYNQMDYYVPIVPKEK